jgi:hypothetical protein
MPEVEDIIHFSNAGQDRSTNNSANKVREDILATILYADDEYLNHPEFGGLWTSIKEKFLTALTSICDEPFKKIIIKQRGGMTFNYDFHVTFLGQLSEDGKTRSLVKEVKLEFKHNNSSVLKLPQFLEMFDKDCKSKLEICDVSYAEFFYDKYLDQYLELEQGVTVPKPTREIYLKNVCDINYNHPFFGNMYVYKSHKTKEKRQLASDSISAYLHEFASTFNFELITK